MFKLSQVRRVAGRIARRAGLACAALAALSALAAAPPALADDSLFQALGGKPGLTRLMDTFGQRLLADSRMLPFFKDVNLPQLKDRLVEQLCEVAGGPCRREGPGMRRAHEGMDISRGDFNALVEVLQHSMDAQQLPFAVQNRLLARLAPMHRDIVNTP